MSVILLLFFAENILSAQVHYSEKKTNFSSPRYDEFSPVIDGDSIVFCSDRQYELFIRHLGSDRKGMLKLFWARTNDSSQYQQPRLFGPDLNTSYNNGPITFDSSGTYAIYCRNMVTVKIAKDLIGKEGNLGLYSAECEDGRWVNIKPFKYNSTDYSNLTPFLTPDGKYLYFSSDKPGGFGGTDLYICEFIDNTWSEPVNLGGTINTTGNETYPFINSSGDLFFASDGYPGLGMKDIFMSKKVGSEWLKPLHLDPPLNSAYNDYSLITDGSFSSGYFSSDRDGSDDIFRFETVIPQLYNCDSLKKNNYCFQFWDDKNQGQDSLKADYQWQFSDGTILNGITVQHCFPGAGNYWALLKISDSTTGETFVVRDSLLVQLEDYEQPFISSKDTLFVSEEASFNALKSNLTDFRPEEYIWDFGDGESAIGPEVKHIYKNRGIFNVKMGVKGKKDGEPDLQINCVLKPVWVIKKSIK